MQRIVRFQEIGGPEVLQIETMSRPKPVLGEVEINYAAFARAKQFLFEEFSDGSLKPPVATTFDLDHVVDAHRFVESNK